MGRLPQPGGDKGTWGDVLNDYLLTSHNADGTVKSGAVTTDAVAGSSLKASKLSTTNSGAAGNALTLASGGDMTWVDMGATYATQASVASTYATQASLSAYATSASVSSTYATQAALTAHAGSSSDPHAAAGYALMIGGGRKIFVQSADPAATPSNNVQDGDLWIDIS